MIGTRAELEAFHKEQAALATTLYVESFSQVDSAKDWELAVSDARAIVRKTLTDTDDLRGISAALQQSGSHLSVLRRMLAPPFSQDQFALLCPRYSKSAEKSGSALPEDKAAAVAEVVLAWRDVSLTPWITDARPATEFEVERAVTAISRTVASQLVDTVRRNRLAAKQEQDVVSMLLEMGWAKRSATLIDTLSSLPAKEFMHKTRFATQTSPQEVDIACGLGNTVVLAMECKVTNDTTNSVKRINDVRNKATAWQQHWGSFVRTAALLQGVVKASDVNRLLHAKVEVFWSHRLNDFREWLISELAAEKT